MNKQGRLAIIVLFLALSIPAQAAVEFGTDSDSGSRCIAAIQSGTAGEAYNPRHPNSRPALRRGVVTSFSGGGCADMWHTLPSGRWGWGWVYLTEGNLRQRADGALVYDKCWNKVRGYRLAPETTAPQNDRESVVSTPRPTPAQPMSSLGHATCSNGTTLHGYGHPRDDFTPEKGMEWFRAKCRGITGREESIWNPPVVQAVVLETSSPAQPMSSLGHATCSNGTTIYGYGHPRDDFTPEKGKKWFQQRCGDR